MELSDFINLPLLREPYNWFVVILILVVVVMIFSMIQAPLNEIGGLVSVV